MNKEYSNISYSEKHHILPKSLGGDNSKSNIVRIPGRVHFICHKLLVRMVIDTKHKKNMIHALNMLARANNKDQNRHQISSKEYELIRKQLSDSMLGENNPMFGKPAPNRNITHTEKTREKLREANNKWNLENPGARKGRIVSDETREKQRQPKSEEGKRNMSISAKKKPRLTCIYCSAFITTSNHTRYHGPKCKKGPQAPSLK